MKTPAAGGRGMPHPQAGAFAASKAGSRRPKPAQNMSQ
jgi:hypothetical protein